jgi:hypothetical protein
MYILMYILLLEPGGREVPFQARGMVAAAVPGILSCPVLPGGAP